jgi:uncharacterized protein YbaR (Trm112 family)
MVVIFGWGAGEAQDLGEVAPAVCPNCHNHVLLHHIRSDKRVTLYFIPLVPYGTDEYLACPICRHGLQLRPENRPAVDRMRAATSLMRKGALRQDYYQTQVEIFWRMIGVAPSGEQVLHPTPTVPQSGPGQGAPAPSAPPAAPSLAAQIEGFARLHADGVLTDDEFATAKRRLLGTDDGPGSQQ